MGPCLSVEEKPCPPSAAAPKELQELNLLRAAALGDVAAARAALSGGASIAVKAANGWPALAMAAQNGRVDMVRFLLQQGADVNSRDWNERTALSHAAQYCHADVVKALLGSGAKWDLHADSEKGGLFPLHYAAARGGVAAVRLLLRAPGASVDVRDEDLNTALHHAACGGHEAVATALLEAGAAVDALCEARTAPLREAASHGHVGVARLLLQKGAKTELRGNELKFPGFTALHHAALSGHADVVNLLLAYGADAEALTRDERRPWDLAANEATRAALDPTRICRISSAVAAGSGLLTPRPSPRASRPRSSFAAARQSVGRLFRRSQPGTSSSALSGSEEAATSATPRVSTSAGGSPSPRLPRRSCLQSSGALQTAPEEPPPPRGSTSAAAAGGGEGFVQLTLPQRIKPDLA